MDLSLHGLCDWKFLGLGMGMSSALGLDQNTFWVIRSPRTRVKIDDNACKFLSLIENGTERIDIYKPSRRHAE